MKAVGLLIGAGIAALAASQADATIYLWLQDDSSSAQMVGSSNTGQLSYTTDFGKYSNSISAFGAPIEKSPTFVTQSINVSSGGAGVYSIYLVQSAVTNLVPTLLSSFTANLFLGDITSVAESTYYSLSDPFVNGQLSANLLGSASFTTIGNSTSTNTLSGVTQPYYQVAKYTVTFGAGGGTVNNTINMSGVPEPATWAMALVGFGFMGFSLRQRRRATVSFG